MTRQLPDSAIEIVTRFEGCELKSYQCPAGVWTIGYGCTGGNIVPGLVITEEVAEEWLHRDLTEVMGRVLKLIQIPLSDNELAAILSFVYNVGIGNFQSSTMYRKLLSHDYAGAADEFPRWTRAAGKVLPGLIKRRAAEKELFLKKGEDDVRN